MMWSIDFDFHLFNLVPTFLRKPVRMAWLKVFLSQLKWLHQQFLSFRIVANREATYNGQVMVLERMLNLNYYDEDIWASPPDPTAAGHIYIDHTLDNLPSNYIFFNSESQEPLYIYNDSEAEPPVFVYSQQEYYSQVAFNVMVPVALTFNQDEMRARIDKYVIAGFNYQIQTY